MHRHMLFAAILALVVVANLDASIARADGVTATVAGGTLKVKGDVAANTLRLDQTALAPGQVRITGFGTMINGAPDPLVVDGVTKGMQVDLGSGDDVLTLEALAVSGPVKVKLG